MDDVVLGVESPGLGDHLIYSTVPELFARRGHRVYASRSIRTRNREVSALLYDENPFITGWSDAPPNAASARPPRPGIPEGVRFKSIIEQIELSHGLPPTNLYPRIYYRPRFRPEFADVIVADPRSSSQHFPAECFDWFLRRLKFPADKTYVIESPNSGKHGEQSALGLPRVYVSGLHEYIDTVYSCLAFISTESGSHALASAIRQDERTPELYAITTTRNWNHGVYIFPNVRYTIVSGLQADW